MVRFIKGLERLFTPVWNPVPQWDLNLVLSRLIGPPFQPLASCSLSHLSWKVAFLVAITSARWVSEIKVLMSESLYMVFYKDKVQLRPHPAFLPKLVSPFHVNQDVFFLVFCPKPHASNEKRRLHILDIKWALAFY